MHRLYWSKVQTNNLKSTIHIIHISQKYNLYPEISQTPYLSQVYNYKPHNIRIYHYNNHLAKCAIFDNEGFRLKKVCYI